MIAAARRGTSRAADARRRREGEAVLEPRVRASCAAAPTLRTSRDRRCRRRRTPRARRLRSRARAASVPRRSSSIRATIRPKVDVAGARAGGVAAQPVEPPHRLGVEADPRREAEAAAVDRPERDAPQPALGKRGADGACGFGRVARQPERARQDARRASREEPDRKRAVGAVQRFVVRAVAGEDDDRVDRVARPPRARARSRGPGAA